MITTKIKNKEEVLRMCIVTKKKYPKKEMIRVIKDANNYYIDHSYDSKKGRSAYIKKDCSLMNKIMRKKILHKTFRTNVPLYVYENLEKELSKYEKK